MKTSILIVDDEKSIREGLAKYLSHDYTTYYVSNGKEALEFLSENHTVDIVLSDIKMPEIEGIELLEKIKSEHMDIKVIFITAFYTIESSISAMKKGAYNCLSKPIDFIKLETILKNAVTNRFC
jgi:DNA-binding NtrC family response regulator